MKAKWSTPLAAAAMLAAMTATASAHPGHDSSGIVSGFMHPLGGLDHILAMVTVGLLAAQLGGRALWLVPLSFVGVMVLGGLAGMAGLTVPFVELGIALSVLVLGLVVSLRLNAAVPAAMALVAFFAVFHGYAHGAEMPENAGGLTYGLGFVVATALLHIAGLGIGLAIGQMRGARGEMLVRSVGGLVALAGAGLVTGLI